MDSQNYSSIKQDNKNISAHWIASRSQHCNGFMHSFQQFVFEYLDFGRKPVCIKFYQDLLNEFKSVPEVSWIAQVQVVDDPKQ